jgi:hypothetical protein
MNQAEINNYLSLQTNINNAKVEVESKKLSIQVAEEELKKLLSIINRTEIEVNLEGYNARIESLNNDLNLIDLAIDRLDTKINDLNIILADLQSEETQIVDSITSKESEVLQKKQELDDLEAQEPSQERDDQIKIVQTQISILSRELDTLSATLRKNQTSQKVLSDDILIVQKEIEQQSEKKTIIENEKIAIQNEFAENQQLLDGLNNEKTIKEGAITTFKSELSISIQELNVLWELFKPISDPRILVEAVNDNSPFLLLPIRLETRFMTIKHVKRVDDINEIPIEDSLTSGDEEVVSKFDFGVDNFIEKVATTEYNAIPRIQIEDTRGVPDRQELWIRIFPDDIAIHTHEQRLTLDEYEAGKTYWSEIWGTDSQTPDLENSRLGAWRALVSSYGPERSAWIRKQTKPTNLETIPTPSEPIFPTLILKLASWADQPNSKVMPDRFVARVYPQGSNYREVLGNLIPDPLPVGFNPSSSDLDDSFDQVDTEIMFPEEIKWLTDFNEAERIGMGIRIPLQGKEADQGFSKIFVLGLKLSVNKSKSKDLLEELIDNHHYTSGGFALLTQGTPTNNTEDSLSGYEGYEVGNEDSFAVEANNPLFQTETDRFNKTDGQWFSEMLGIQESTLHHVRNTDKYDQREGMAMNIALWPATMGYYIKQMLTPMVFSGAHNDVRKFYCDHLIARGRIPSFRVDNQPYGVLVATSFSKWKFPTQNLKKIPVSLKNMYEKVLLPMNNDYNNNISKIIHAGSTGDPQDNFLKMLGLHASSVEYHQRFGGGQYFTWNLLKYFQNAPGQPSPPTSFPVMNDTIPNALRNLYVTSTGFNIPINPRILQMLFVSNQRLLNGPVIDLEVLPFSEIRGIQKFPETDLNYIEWMLISNFHQIRAEDFSNIPGVQNNQKPPKALLYLLLRHGYLLEYINTATQILLSQKVIQEEAQIEFELQKAINEVSMSVEEEKLLTNLVTAEVTLDFEYKLEKQIEQQEAKGIIKKSARESTKEKIRQQEAKNVEAVIKGEIKRRIEDYSVELSKWNYVTGVFTSVTGQQTMLEYILSQMELGDPHTGYLIKMKNALEILKDMPTARLERCLAESLDVCNYRLDAWLMGLVNQRLEAQMETQRIAGNPGTNLGSFGMLENLKPNTSFPGIYVEEVDTTADPNSPNFVYLGKDPLTILEYNEERNKIVSPPRVNAQNLGFIHGPSMNHAIAAAILRAGYGAHEGTASPDDALAINLRSDRVRKALFYIEGIRNGQDLAALLGYQFERSLHDLDAGLDQYILDIRRKYPLVANGMVADEPAETSIESFEARNVVDGLKLIEAFRDNASDWFTGTGIINPSTEYDLIAGQIIEVANHMDAIGDLMMAESMYQVATGNQERAGAVLKALGEGNVIPDPQIINTPRLDKVYMQRKAVMFDICMGTSTSWPGQESPRSFSEPALNCWLKCQLPDPANVIINYQYTTVDLDGTEIITDDQLSLSSLGLQPIDLVYLLTDQGGSEDGTLLSSLINYLVIHTISQTEIPVAIKFIDRSGLTNNQITIFELLPLIRSLQDMIGQGRPARPEDFLIEGEVFDIIQASSSSEGIDLTNVEARLTDAFGPSITPGRKGLVEVKNDLQSAMDNADSIVEIAGNESLLDDLRDALLATISFAIQGAIPEVAYSYTIEARNKLSAQATRILSQLSSIEAKVNLAFTELSGLTEIDDRLEKLSEIGQLLFGRSYKVFPEFKFYNKADIDLSRANPNLLEEGGDFAIEEWLQGIAKVRPKMSNYHLSTMVSESLLNEERIREVIQLPVVSNLDDRWLSSKLPSGYEIPDQAISLVLDLPDNYLTCELQSGIIIDEWTESIPESEAVTGLSFNYDQPNSEAPNTLLLAVTPEEKGKWLWSDLMDTLDETLLLAKKRAIDPDIINENSALGHALPAIVASVEAADTAPGLDFSRNIVAAPSGQVGPIDLQEFPAEVQ